MTSEAALEELLAWYDSYRFCPDSPTRVCNPISFGDSFLAALNAASASRASFRWD